MKNNTLYDTNCSEVSRFKPKVSIVIPVYNGSNYLKEAIDSALAQTYKNVEVIVINDGSNDGGKTDRICKSYGKKIRYFKKENGGVSSALNMGIEKMEGEYFSWLSHDDIYYPEKIEKQVEALSTLNDKETIIYSDYSVVDEQLKEVYTEHISELISSENLNKPLYSLLMGYINGLSLLIHKRNFQKYGVFNEKLITTQDYDLWFRILRHSKIHYVPGVLTKTRIHPNQTGNLLKNTHREEKFSIWKRMFASLSDSEKVLMSGSVVSFYEEFYTHFLKLNINEELQYILLNLLLREYLKNFNGESKELTQKEALKKIATKLDVNNRAYLSLLLSETIKDTQKPRIVFWSDNWKYRGGLNRVLVSIAEQLSDQFEVLICTWKDKESDKGFEIPDKVKFFEFDQSSLSIDKIPELMLLMGVNIFICSQNFDTKYLELYKRFKELGIKSIAWDHSYYFLIYYYKWLLGAAKIKNRQYLNVDCVVCVNKLSSRIFSELNIRAITIKNPVSIRIPKRVNIEGRKQNIIAVGRFDDYQKRLDLLLEVFAEVLKKLPNVKLYVVGSYNLHMPITIGAVETFAQYIKRLKIPKDSIIFVGHVDDVEKYYKRAQLHLMTSEREGFGIVIVEAAAFGVPSIVFQGNGSEDTIKDGENGYIIPQKDTKLMAKKTIQLLQDSKRMQLFSRNAFKMVREYMPELVSQNWLKLCNILLLDDRNKLLSFISSENKNNTLSKSERILVNMYEDALVLKSEEMDNTVKNYEEQVESLKIKIINLENQLVERSRIRYMVKSIILKSVKYSRERVEKLLRKIINKE